MPRRRQAAKPRRGELGVDQYDELEIGPGRASAFVSEEQRREAYFANRDQIMEGPAGSRPWGWWEYESGLGGRPEAARVVTDRRGYVIGTSADAEIEWLRKHGHLTVFEKRELEQRRRLTADAGAKTIALNPDHGGAS